MHNPDESEYGLNHMEWSVTLEKLVEMVILGQFYFLQKEKEKIKFSLSLSSTFWLRKSSSSFLFPLYAPLLDKVNKPSNDDKREKSSFSMDSISGPFFFLNTSICFKWYESLYDKRFAMVWCFLFFFHFLSSTKQQQQKEEEQCEMLFFLGAKKWPQTRHKNWLIKAFPQTMIYMLKVNTNHACNNQLNHAMNQL